MKQSVRLAIYQAISENHWLKIKYKNKEKQITDFYIGINDVDTIYKKISCEIFNCYKDNRCIDDPKPLYADGIIAAEVLEQSYYPTPAKLMELVDSNYALKRFLDVDKIDNDILRYLSDCYRLDNDPYIRDKVYLNGVDLNVLRKEKEYKLDDEQFETLLNKLFKVDYFESEKLYRSKDFCINVFSLDINNKQYVIAYYSVSLNFKNRTLKIGNKLKFNKSFFLEEGKKATLGLYLDISQEDFCKGFMENYREYVDMIKGNCRNGERIDTSPELFLLEREFKAGVDRTFEEIYNLQEQNKLTFPLKSFFGRNRSGSGSNKETNIVVFDKNKINIDQMRVVYNSMVNHVTYVKGPPGTGKTETIFNVLLSSYYNDKRVLVCSNNNHPVNDIYEKMLSSFKKGDSDFIFPIIRLGNREELVNSIIKLKEAYNFALANKNRQIYDVYTEQVKNKSLKGFQELKALLKEYEERAELIDKIETLKKINSLTTTKEISNEIQKQIENQERKLGELKEIQDEDVAKYSVSANEDQSFQNYVFYSSLARMKKLLNPAYRDIRDIAKIDDVDLAINELTKYLKIDENLRRFTDIFPIIITTNISADKLGGPKQHFDLCIMDESGQCNTAVSLIPIIRAENLLLVGDTNQLQPVTVIESDINDALMEKYHIKQEYNYIKNSILSTMLSKDRNSKSILLRYHYRCGKKIAGFVNSRFYQKQLKLMNQYPGNLLYLDVKNKKIPDLRNAYREEAEQIAKVIKQNGYQDVAIVTPFVNQAALINDYLQKYGIDTEKIKAGTIHSLQGSERKVIIMSTALSLNSGKKTMDWIKNNHELINVAVTRAKETLVFVGDRQAINALSGNETNDLKELSDYIASNGTIEIVPSAVSISTDFSNDSTSEKEFFDVITPYFTRRGSKMRIVRNVPATEAIRHLSSDDKLLIGKKEFDVVVQANNTTFSNNRYYKTVVVFEIDGGEHIGSSLTAARDRVKEEICARNGIKLIRIANSEVKDYELIIRLFESIIKGIPDFDNVNEQLSLFEE